MHKNRHITKQGNTPLVGVPTQLLPLLEKHELFKFDRGNPLAVLLPGPSQCLGLAQAQLSRPLLPAWLPLGLTQRRK
jgi:hypothetical protein